MAKGRSSAIAGALAVALAAVVLAPSEERRRESPRSRALGLLDPALVADRPIVVTGRRDRGGRCGVRSVARGFVAVTEAVNRGDVERLRDYLAPEPEFQWFAMNVLEQSDADLRANRVRGLGGFEASDHATLLRWVQRRRRMRERLALREIAVRRMPAGSWFPELRHEVAGVEFAMRRTAADLPSGPGTSSRAEGKGGIDCHNGRLFVFTSALNVRATRERSFLCPAPPPRSPAAAVVACRLG